MEAVSGHTRLERGFDALCTVAALAGGLLLVAIALMTVFSVTARTLFGAPLAGEYELVEMGTAVAVSLLLPYGQLRRGNPAVGFATGWLSPSRRAVFDAFGDMLLGVLAVVIAWRLCAGLEEFRRFGSESMVLGIPTWWSMVPMVFGMALLGLACAVTACMRLRERPPEDA